MLKTIKDMLIEATTQRDIQSDTTSVTLEEQQVLDIIGKNPNVTQAEIAAILNVSDRTVKRRMESLKDKGVISRSNGKRSGEWEILK